MDFMLEERNVEIEDVGKICSTPINNISKLMYYLLSLSSCLENLIPNQYTDYEKYMNLSEVQKIKVVTLAVLLSPDVLLNKVIFGVEENNPILKGRLNTFLKITNAQIVMAAETNLTETILIGEKNVKVSKILIFTESWLKRFYRDPMVAESYRCTTTPKASPVTTKPETWSTGYKTSPVNTKTETWSTGYSVLVFISCIIFFFWTIGGLTTSWIVISDDSLDPCTRLRIVCQYNIYIFGGTIVGICLIKGCPSIFSCCILAAVCSSIATSVIVVITYFIDSCSQTSQDVVISLFVACCCWVGVVVLFGCCVYFLSKEENSEEKPLVE